MASDCFWNGWHMLLLLLPVLRQPSDFFGAIRVAVLQFLLLVTDPDAPALTLEDIVSGLLALELGDRCPLEVTLVTFQFALHEALLVEPHLL